MVWLRVTVDYIYMVSWFGLLRAERLRWAFRVVSILGFVGSLSFGLNGYGGRLIS